MGLNFIELINCPRKIAITSKIQSLAFIALADLKGRFLLDLVVHVVSVHSFGFVFAVESLFHVHLQLSYDQWVEFLEVELSNYLPCTVLDDIENPFHVLLG